MATQSAVESQHTNAETDRSRKQVKEHMQRSSSSLSGCSFNNPNKYHSIKGSLRRSLSVEFINTEAVALEQSQEQGGDSCLLESTILSSSQTAPRNIKSEMSLENLKSRRSACTISWGRWSWMRRGIRRRRKVISLTRRKSTDETNKRADSKITCLKSQVFSSKDSIEDIDMVNQYTATSNQNKRTLGKGYHSSSSPSLGQKYQPKLFQEIAGHEIIIKTLSASVQKKKIAPLYLFHGPSGTGKTSTARIFAMALNCESTSLGKPCWSCQGCSRSLYIMKLCHRSRISGFERIRTLLQSTNTLQAVSDFKVFVIEECHSLTTKVWDELLGIVDRGYDSTVVFVMITEDEKMVPKAISSRCQKFCFSKLKDMDITLKLARIVAREDIGIEKDALKLIITKADGSLREAENILDPLTLLGTRITSPMVQQLVGLVPHNKLLDLLSAAISANTINTIRSTRELIASGIEPQALVSQLASLITDILTSAAAASSSASPGSSKDSILFRNCSQFKNNQSGRLYHALKVLVETEKQLKSSTNHPTWLLAALMQIASEDASNRITTGIVFPGDIIIPPDEKPNSELMQNSMDVYGNRPSKLVHHSESKKNHHFISKISKQPDISTNDSSIDKIKRCRGKTIKREFNSAQISNIEEVWQNMLGRIQSTYVREFLSQQGKLASLTISTANAIVHLVFKRPEDKLAAQMSEEAISKALKNAIGCPVTVNMSLEPMQLEVTETTRVSRTNIQAENCGNSKQQQEKPLPKSHSPCSPNTTTIMQDGTNQISSFVSENSKPMTLQENIQLSQGQDRWSLERKEESTGLPQQIIPLFEHFTQGSKANGSIDTEIDPSTRNGALLDISYIMRATTNKPKHRWLSQSSIQQGDASVEPYSQDLLFENAITDKDRGVGRNSKLQKSFSKAKDHPCQHNSIIV